ncbi:uncharacterized protein K460DRAFT_362558 [Cucurbitaria berberidis CBS 394.84]|uniref:Fatty acid desaturase domain-containing protein n=1 Tax=Cucurbitaria berberidis CBS 394.84 TaxID=1168544 RepID=A0A9P4LEX3_9PLEO|nr:uncharacterized protein K460DRAFT_362558 [Cucurbitaria berberidis CBS 394.84]KAF1851812.1 hypothetical protein K460DRAFT_362558 [Cucurbitaria berberidis CBS 394.84]
MVGWRAGAWAAWCLASCLQPFAPCRLAPLGAFLPIPPSPAYLMPNLWAWIRHPRLSLYIHQRKHHRVPPDARKDDRIDRLNIHRVYPGVTEFLLSQQSLAYDVSA